MTNEEIAQIVADGEYWKQLQGVLGWRVLGFTYRSSVTLVDKRNRTINLDGEQFEDLLKVLKVNHEADPVR